MDLMKKWDVLRKALAIVIVLFAVRTVIFILGYDTVPINPVVGAFITGLLFTIAVIFTGTFTDFKESEKIAGDMAAALKALYNDSIVIPLEDDVPLITMRSHIRTLLTTINTSLTENNFNARAINHAMDIITDDIRILAKLNVAPPTIAKLRVEMGALDKLVNRVEVIIRTEFIPAAYVLAEVATAAIIFVMLFVQNDLYLEGSIVFVFLSLILIALVMLIKDMDNPFEFYEGMSADVDVDTLLNLEQYFEEREARLKKTAKNV
ncbi:MAG: hypothetical protein ACXW1N_07080 [Halobacteriota archaeon]